MSTTGHESEAINVGGLKASMQKLKTEYLTDVAHLGANDGTAVIADFDPQTDTVWKKAQTLSAAEKAQVKTNLGLPNEVYSKTEVNDLVDTPHQNYVTVATYASLPASGSADTIYRVSNYNGSTSQVDATKYSEYAWNGSTYVFLNVKSQVGEVFDISEYNASAKYADLAAALGNNGANVPEGVRKGGMSVKYVNTDNKYVQYRLMSQDWSTNIWDWQGLDKEPKDGSKNLVESGGVKKELNAFFKPLNNGDFGISDENNNLLVLFKNGNIKTKEFDSATTSDLKNNESTIDLDIRDENDNILLILRDGHIITKNFDSSDFAVYKRFKGKRLAIVGDSISTFSGTMPSGYEAYYPHGEVQNQNQIWWDIVCSKLQMTYTNCSWSGSKVSGAPKGATAIAGCSDRRVSDLGLNGAPDIIICFISCNDWGSDVPLGSWQVSDAIVNDSSYTPQQTIDTFREAFSLMLYKIMNTYKNASVFVCTNLDDLPRDRNPNWPSNNRNNISTFEWNENVTEVARALGAKVIDVHACGINYINISNYCVDSGIHPNIAGHRIIANYIISQLNSLY